MLNRLAQSVQQKSSNQNLQQNEDSDNSDQSEDYYEYQRRKMQAALAQLKTRQNNSILEQLKKNTTNEIQYLQQFQDQVDDLHNITRNNHKNVLDESIIKEIKQKVFSQSMLHTIQLADLELENKKNKQQALEKQSKDNIKDNKFKKQADQIQLKLNKKMQSAKVQRQIVQMSLQDQYSMKYQQKVLSDFFADRFFTPELKSPVHKKINFKTENYNPKATFTNLKPLANTQNNVLPRNAPQIALRRLGKAKKINLISSSSSQIAVKIKKLNPQQSDRNKKIQPDKKRAQKQCIDEQIGNYLSIIKPFIPRIKTASENYRPKFINQYRSQNQQNFNIDDNLSQQKSLKDCIEVEKPENIKDIKLTFEHMNNLNGIQKYTNIQLAALQFNSLTLLNGIQNCQKLIQVNFSHNKIKSIESLKNLKWLRLLNIQNNLVQMIDLKGGNLEILYASNNRIQQIVDLSLNAYMKRLNIAHNKLHNFNGLAGLHYLQEIQAHSNYIDTLQGLKQCILLRYLDICHNRLKLLPQNMTFIFLNKLKLSHNHIQKFPNTFLPSLQQLYLDHNKIQQQSQSIIYLPNLRLLNLDDNKLTGFSVVWAFLRYTKNMQTLKFDKNQYFQNLREKVRELYEYIVYKNMNKLKILNQSAFDIGIKKYYENVYGNYLTQKPIFRPESLTLRQVQNKILFTIKQNQYISNMQDKKLKFSESQIFIKQKSINKADDLLQIIQFMENKKDAKIMHATKSVFYQHDRYQYKLRGSMHKIANMVIGKQYRVQKRKGYFRKNREKILGLLRYVEQYVLFRKIQNAVAIFHLPLERMSEEKAAIIIQKNWKCYRLRKKYKRIMAKLRQKNDDSDLQPIDLDQYDFDNCEMYQFNFELPQELDFDQFIIKPQIFQLLNKQQVKREQDIQNRSMVSNGANQPNNAHPRGGQGNNRNGQMVNNFMQDNQSHMTEHQSRESKRQDQIQKIMKQWGVNREAAIALVAKNQLKQERKRKQAEKNMSAAQRYEKLKKNHR